MSEKAITIYTPSDADPHITADDDAFIYDSILGGRSGILGDMTCDISTGSVVLEGGGVSNRGYILRIPSGENVTITVPTGSQGLNRIDTVVSQFTKGAGTVADQHVITLVKGTAATSPVPPTLTESKLTNAGDINQVALYYIMVSGVEVVGMVPIAETLGIGDNSVQVYVQSEQPTSPNIGDLWFW